MIRIKTKKNYYVQELAKTIAMAKTTKRNKTRKIDDNILMRCTS